MNTVTIKEQLVSQYIQRFPEEAAVTLNMVKTKELLDYMQKQPVHVAQEVLLHLNPETVSRVLDDMEDILFIALFDLMNPYDAAKLISRLSASSVTHKLSLLDEKKSEKIGEMLNYPAESAGHLMDTRIITFHPKETVNDVLTKLRTLGDRRIVNIYITDTSGQLLGTVYIQTLAVSNAETTLEKLMEPAPSVQVMTPSDEIIELFEAGKFFNLPVVDLSNNLLGIIRNDRLIAATQMDAREDVLAMFGAGREERALSSPWFAVKKRLPWLHINLVTAFLAASIVGIFEDTIAQVTVLAVFLPVVAGQSGNTGSQALAVTMRGLALREIQTRHWWKVARKEVAVGFFNGVAVALTTSAIVFIWASSFGLAVVIATSMILSMVIAGFSGAVIPIILKAFGQDPAQSSAIVLTTVTDIVGFLSFLGLTTMLGSALGIL